MSRWLKVTIVLAAVAFVVGFRVHASNDTAEPAQAALNAQRASSAVETAPRKAGSTIKLADVAALPDLKGESPATIAARARKEAAEKRAKARAKAAAERRAKERAAARKRAAAKRKRERAAARRRAAARNSAPAPQPVATPRVVVTPVPTPVYKPPVYTPPAPKKSYVGKDFDSKG